MGELISRKRGVHAAPLVWFAFTAYIDFCSPGEFYEKHRDRFRESGIDCCDIFRWKRLQKTARLLRTSHSLLLATRKRHSGRSRFAEHPWVIHGDEKDWRLSPV